MKAWCVPMIALPLLLAGCQSTGSLGGTSWTVLDVLAPDHPEIVDMDISFGADGMVETTTTNADGSSETTRRHYDVHDATISVRRAEGDLHVLHRIDGDQMYLTAESFQARLMRMD